MFVRIFTDSVSALAVLLGTALLLGAVALLGDLRSAQRARAAPFPPLLFFPLPILVFMLLGFLLGLLVCAVGQRRAGDDGGGNSEGGARRGGGRGGGEVLQPVALRRGPVGCKGAGWWVPAWGALVHRQVLGAAALRGAGRVGVGGRAGLLVRRCGRVGRDGEVGGRGAQRERGGERRAFGAGTALLLAVVGGRGGCGGGGGWRRGGPSVGEVGDAGFLWGQRVDEVKAWRTLLRMKTTQRLVEHLPSLHSRLGPLVFQIPEGTKVHCLWVNCL